MLGTARKRGAARQLQLAASRPATLLSTAPSCLGHQTQGLRPEPHGWGTGSIGLGTYALCLLPMSARWEEEYTVRIQLQERVNELQEVRVPHCLGFPQSSPLPPPWSPLLVPPCLALPPTLAVPLTSGFLLGCRKPRRPTPARRSWQ